MNLQTLLVFTPYEGRTKNLLTTQEFSNRLLCETTAFKELACEILNDITDDFTVKFLSGFPGSGKTTFFNWLKYIVNNPNSDFTQRLCRQNAKIKDALDSRKDTFVSVLNFSFTNKGEFTQVKNLFIETVSNNYPSYRESINFVIEKKEKMLDFTNVDFESLYAVFDNTDENKIKIYEELEKLKISDYQIILFLLIHKARTAHINGKKFSLCLIDNVDALKPELMYGEFWDIFCQAYQKFSQITDSLQNDLLGNNCLEIIFSLRNYNFARMNFEGHDFDQIDDQLDHDNPYILIFGDDEASQNLRHLLEKRLDYYNSQNEHSRSKNENLEYLVSLIVKEDSPFREKFYLPLFNYDIRHFNQEIHRMVSRKNVFIFDKEKYDLIYDDEISRSGARGIIIHNLIKTLFLSKRKYPIDHLIKEEGISTNQQYKNAKYCSISRVLLTIIYNLTYGDNPLNKNLDEINDPRRRDYFTYADLISEIRLSPVNSNCKTILDLINMNFAQLISRLETFHGMNNESIIHFMDARGISTELNFENKLVFKDKDELLKAQTMKTNMVIISEKYNSFKMQINPSAIVYLRYLVTHFEYFSAHCYWKNERSFERKFYPLYLATNKNSQNNKFEFEKLLEDVFSLVERKKKVNDNLIKELISPKNKWGVKGQNLNVLLASKLIFKQDIPNNDYVKGSLYSSRVITFHLSYIEQFRHHLNNNIDFLSKYPNEMNKVNEFILNILLRYVYLYLNTEHSIKEKRIGDVINAWRDEINKRLVGATPLTRYIQVKDN